MNINQLTKDEYVQHCNLLADVYENDVINNNIVSNKYIKQAVIREQQLRVKYKYNQNKVDEVFKFAYYVNIEKKKRIKLLAYQCWIIKCVFGLYSDDDYRLRREALVWISRKNGKTAFTALLALYSMIKDNQGLNNEVYFLATTQNQATQALNYLKSMIWNSESLNKRVDVLQYRLRYKKTSFAKPLPANADKLDSLNPSFAILDESHAHQTRALFNIIKTGQIARNEALIFEISTAGFNKSYPFYTAIEQAKEILNNNIKQDNQFIALYTLDDEAEIDDSSMWLKANPAIGELININTLVDNYDKAKRTQSELASFITKNLNIYTCSESTWIDDEMIVKASQKLDIKDFEGCKAWLGLDLSATRDLTALGIAIEKDGIIYLFSEYYYPDNQDGIIRLSGLDITGWLNDDYIIKHNSRTINYSLIAERVNYYASLLDIQKIGYDQWNSSTLITELAANYNVQSCKQSTSFMNMPMKYFEKQMFENLIIIDKNPVTRWNFQNVVLYIDSNACIKIDKNKRKDSVDGAVALMMGLGLLINDIIIDEKERQRIINQNEIINMW